MSEPASQLSLWLRLFWVGFSVLLLLLWRLSVRLSRTTNLFQSSDLSSKVDKKRDKRWSCNGHACKDAYSGNLWTGARISIACIMQLTSFTILVPGTLSDSIVLSNWYRGKYLHGIKWYVATRKRDKKGRRCPLKLSDSNQLKMLYFLYRDFGITCYLLLSFNFL